MEIFYKGNWGTVCDDYWDMNDARVVCRQLGFPNVDSAPGSARFGSGSGQIWLDNVGCSGSESSIINCQHRGWGVENCGHSEDASVICSSKLCTKQSSSRETLGGKGCPIPQYREKISKYGNRSVQPSKTLVIGWSWMFLQISSSQKLCNHLPFYRDIDLH